VQVLVFSPAAAQVAGVVVTHSPQTCSWAFELLELPPEDEETEEAEGSSPGPPPSSEQENVNAKASKAPAAKKRDVFMIYLACIRWVLFLQKEKRACLLNIPQHICNENFF
jgi:hypothetical protein